MKKSIYPALLMLAAGWLTQACDDGETYAEMKDKERDAINAFIESESINVISTEQFYEQDSLTDVEKNEFVLFKDNGVYMQIVRKGEGTPLEDGERAELIARYKEVNIKTGETLTANIFSAANPDLLTVTNKAGSYTGSFTSGYMYSTYGSSVPSGWLVPMPYIKLGRNTDKIAKLRLIVPHSQGQSTASSYVYPCYYEITYQKGR